MLNLFFSSIYLIQNKRLQNESSAGDQHTYSVSDRNQYTGVEVRYIVPGTAKRKKLIVGEETRLYKIRKLYNNEKEANIAADQQLKRLKRSAASVQVNLARGNATLSAESPLKLVALRLRWMPRTGS